MASLFKKNKLAVAVGNTKISTKINVSVNKTVNSDSNSKKSQAKRLKAANKTVGSCLKEVDNLESV